ncbi:MAG: gamma-glutamyl-gamma-aminobutyrate hydrolase family protein [Deltaproteobacteria bacterium]|nr:gamma-glutamyl-gamma-aminobutyrate hydrolase family protein [Deltaproteobacteria bacterium]
MENAVLKGMPRPLVVVTLDESETLRRGVPVPTVVVKRAYADAVERAGGIPLMVAPSAEREVIDGIIEVMDALVLTGGAFDIDPTLSGVKEGLARETKPRRTRFELALVEAALERKVPVLGVCGGMQLLNVALGGTLIGDIGTEVEGAIEHEQANPITEPSHRIEITPGSRLAVLAGDFVAEVNTTHHQAVGRLGRRLTVTARGPDGVIEAIEHENGAALGIQWHPEQLPDRLSLELYANLVRTARTTGEKG